MAFLSDQILSKSENAGGVSTGVFQAAASLLQLRLHVGS
eukprot:COSAG03_NODE_3767_length_1839_cov_2.380460_3_plen_38_part_01